MTVIRPNSVAGINSITVQSGNSLAVHKANGELIRTLTSSSGVSTFSSISVGTATTDNSAEKSINIGLGASISQHDDNTLTFGTAGDPQVVIGADGGVTIKDSIIHDGDTNTKIRFVENDKISLETAGSERLRLDNQYLIKGHTSTYPIAGHYPSVQLTGTTFNDATLSIINNANDATGSYLYFSKQRSGSPGGATVVQDDDLVGHIGFTAGDGTDVTSRIAEIKGIVDGTPGGNDTPGRLSFWTTADGAQSSTERLRIDSSGRLGIQGAATRALLEVRASGGSNTMLTALWGANEGTTAGTLSDDTDKAVRMGIHHYDTDALPYAFLVGSSGSSANNLTFGGGTSLMNAATEIKFKTAANTTTTNGTERMVIDSSGDVTISDGDLVIGTAGHGIDFSAQTVTSVTGCNTTSELLDHYEEGTFGLTVISGGFSSVTGTGSYTRIGRVVIFQGDFSLVGSGDGNILKMSGLPYDANSWVAHSGYTQNYVNEGSQQISWAIRGNTNDISAVEYGNEAAGNAFSAGYLNVAGCYNI